MYAYLVILRKVNHTTTGFHHGLKRRRAYPVGLRTVSIPYQKLPEFFAALGEMDWTTITFRGGAESKGELQRQIEHWQEMARVSGTKMDLHWVRVPVGRGGRCIRPGHFYPGTDTSKMRKCHEVPRVAYLC